MKLVSKPWAIACVISCTCFACGNSDSGPAPGGAGGTVGGSGGGSAGASGAGLGGAAGASGSAGAPVEPLGPGSTYLLTGYRSYEQANAGLDLDGRGGPTQSAGHCKPAVPYTEADLADNGNVDNSFARFYVERWPWISFHDRWSLDLAVPVVHISRAGGVPVSVGLMAADDSAMSSIQGMHDGTAPIDVLRDTVEGDPLKPFMRTANIEQVGNRLWIRFREPLVISHRKKRTAQLTIHDPIIALPANADLDAFRLGYITLAGWLDPAEFKAESEEYLTQLQYGFCKLDTDPFAVADLEIGTNTGTCNAISFGLEILADKVVFGGLTDREAAGPQPTECVPLEE